MNTQEIDMDQFHERLQQAIGEMSYRKLGRLTDTHPETVRRYMQGQAPSAIFLINLCRVFGISGDWLLTGRGAMRCSKIKLQALQQAQPTELLTALAASLGEQNTRLERLEKCVQQSISGPTVYEPKTSHPKASRLHACEQTSHEHVSIAGQASNDGFAGAAEQREGGSVDRIREALRKRTA